MITGHKQIQEFINIPKFLKCQRIQCLSIIIILAWMHDVKLFYWCLDNAGLICVWLYGAIVVLHSVRLFVVCVSLLYKRLGCRSSQDTIGSEDKTFIVLLPYHHGRTITTETWLSQKRISYWSFPLKIYAFNLDKDNTYGMKFTTVPLFKSFSIVLLSCFYEPASITKNPCKKIRIHTGIVGWSICLFVRLYALTYNKRQGN